MCQRSSAALADAWVLLAESAACLLVPPLSRCLDAQSKCDRRRRHQQVPPNGAGRRRSFFRAGEG